MCKLHYLEKRACLACVFAEDFVPYLIFIVCIRHEIYCKSVFSAEYAVKLCNVNNRIQKRKIEDRALEKLLPGFHRAQTFVALPSAHVTVNVLKAAFKIADALPAVYIGVHQRSNIHFIEIINCDFAGKRSKYVLYNVPSVTRVNDKNPVEGHSGAVEMELCQQRGSAGKRTRRSVSEKHPV